MQRLFATFCILIVSLPPTVAQNAPRLSPDQLDNLVAPVALYPDPLLGQVMAASTYPCLLYTSRVVQHDVMVDIQTSADLEQKTGEVLASHLKLPKR